MNSIILNVKGLEPDTIFQTVLEELTKELGNRKREYEHVLAHVTGLGKDLDARKKTYDAALQSATEISHDIDDTVATIRRLQQHRTAMTRVDSEGQSSRDVDTQSR